MEKFEQSPYKKIYIPEAEERWSKMSLDEREELLDKIVPIDQSFDMVIYQVKEFQKLPIQYAEKIIEEWEKEKSSQIESEGLLGMKFIEGHPICGDCLKNTHDHPLELKDRGDCKNTDKIGNRIYQCHCGFGGIYKDGKWQERE